MILNELIGSQQHKEQIKTVNFMFSAKIELNFSKILLRKLATSAMEFEGKSQKATKTMAV